MSENDDIFDEELNFEDSDEYNSDDPQEGMMGPTQMAPEESFGDDYELEIDDEGSKIAASSGKNMLVMFAMIIASVIFLYNVVFKDDEVTQKEKEKQEVIDAQPVEQAQEVEYFDPAPQDTIGVIETPELPDVEGLNAPSPPQIAEPVVSFPEPIETFEPEEPKTQQVAEPATQEVPEPTTQEVVVAPDEDQLPKVVEVEQPITQPIQPVVVGPSAEEIAARKAARRKASMLVMNGGGSPTVDIDEEGNETDSFEEDPVLLKQLTKTSATQVIASKIGNTDFIIAQGKMISAVLETSINTDLPGSLRAVISRDIYAESGRNVLIPKGSRLIGTYEDSVSLGQKRVVVSWQRIIRPDGIDINISSPGTDQLGRAGVTGIVDNKYFEIFGSSILISAITIASSIALEALDETSDSTSSTSTTADGTTTTSETGNASDLAVLDAVSEFSDVATDAVKKRINEEPTILVNQGTRIKVFVNQDMIFPASIATGINVIN